MKKVIIYHNPRCSKSRQALQLLLEHELKPTIIEYLKEPPKKNEILELLKMLSLSPREIMRHNESLYKELKLDNTKLTDKALINAMIENPILIERPIVIINNKALIARPPEKVLELL